MPAILAVDLHQVLDLMQEEYTDYEIARQLRVDPMLITLIREINFLA